MRANGGFTLIELILVTVILGILAGMVTVNYGGRAEEARISRAQADIVAYENAIELFAIDNNDRYPSNLNDLVSGERVYLRGGVKRDPWGNDYVYQHPGRNNTHSYDLFSRGPDGVAGTSDDITNWEND